jgi:hypothetical protein
MVGKVEGNEARRRLFIGKNRGGPRGDTIPLAFAGASYRFTESEEEEHFSDDMPDKPRRGKRR